ncbi:Uma2 family endonuclease [Thermus antranikianii]|uniref:Uma2 family endonuclease n=1 Tax=Thermus antranikianii TaxID=88190 RepID=A0ABY7RNR2_9DEIN|nr:Uma2 family endonuclease [Thermus antranikianii]QWK22335.1 MAG: Uma2 family endonuclease [Thermus antranikianii]WCM39008.1 Uma2 family endonuclease [Thermus antranikianii]
MVQPRRFTREEYHRLLEAGVIQEDERVELIEGTVVEMGPIGNQHTAVVKRLNALFHQTLAGQALVGVQGPIRLSPLSEPQPDLVLLRPRPDFYAQDHPGPEDIVLLVEVAEASLGYDRQVKLPLYAQAGIPEVWLVNLGERRVEVYRNPLGGGYQEMRELGPEDTLSPMAFPQVALKVRELLP